MNKLFGLIILLSLLSTPMQSTFVFAQGSTTIPPSGPKDPLDESLKDIKSLEKANKDFIENFKIRLKFCLTSPHLQFEKRKLRKLEIGDVYSQLLYLGVSELKDKSCDPTDGSVEKILHDNAVKCIFKNRTANDLEKMIKNPIFDSYIQNKYPKLSDPKQVRILFEKIITSGKYNELKK